MSSKNSIHFDNDLIAETFQLFFEDFHKNFFDDFLNLIIFDFLTFQYKFEKKFVSTWNKLLQSIQIYQFFIAVSNDYQIDYERFLLHFRTSIQQLMNIYLAAFILQRKNRKNFINALNQWIEILNTKLAIKNYDIILNETILK